MKTSPASAALRPVHQLIETVPCPQCGQPAGQRCRHPGGRRSFVPHGARRRAAADTGAYRPAGAGGSAVTLTLETRNQQDRTAHIGPVMLTPPIDEGYWSWRVRLSGTQSIVGFPKFGTIGIGFAQEEDWNTNLPYTCDTEEIYDHIAHNKGDDAISRNDCLAAIRLIQAAIEVRP